MFGVPIEKIKKGNPEYELRQKGKVAELALGYQGGAGALIAMGAIKMGIPEEDLPDIVSRWRDANRHIVELWYDLENAAISVIQTGKQVVVNNLVFSREFDLNNDLDFMTIMLPSGRKLYYARPELSLNQWGRTSIGYYGINQTSRQWMQLETYGGKLVENCIAQRTQVLTSRGWLPIEDVQLSDKLWDGENWVQHQGLIDKGIQETISVDGVHMTPDHKILTKEGWQSASSCKAYGMHLDETRRYEQVYDLRNAGDKHCFTVKSETGAMIVHNCVQAIARDCLAVAIERLEAAGFPVVFHVHDEVIIDCPEDKVDLEKVISLMTEPISWAQGLPLGADGWVGDYYKKD